VSELHNATLMECLAHEDGWPVAKAALKAPWCWPRDAGLHEELALRDCPPADPLRPGEVLLVSVSENGVRSAMWRAGPESVIHRVGGARPVRLVGTAAQVVRLAHRIAARDLPVLANPRHLHDESSWLARSLAKHGDGTAPAFLDGPSFGLALCLASAGLFLATPLPVDIVALGCVGPDGAVTSVDGLRAKIAIVHAWAPSVRRLLVAREQRDEAQRILAELNADLELADVARLDQAFGVAFPLEAMQLSRDEVTNRRILADLYRQALRPDACLLGWRAVSGAARQLVERLESDPEAVRKAQLVADIADRHEGAGTPLALPDSSWLAAQPRPLRLQIVAHVLQSAADSFSPAIHQLVDAALELVPHDLRERGADDLIVIGAAARALAVAEPADLEGATGLALSAVEGWFSVFREEESSRVLCELVRLRGLQREPDRLREVMARFVTPLLDGTRLTEADRGFLAVAGARAYVLCGQPTNALNLLLDPAQGRDAWPGHVQYAACRWLARAFAALGDLARAAQWRESIEAAFRDSSREPDPNLLLARVDAALERADDVEPHIHALLKHSEAQEFCRALIGSPTSAASAHRLSDTYRY
jgi:hypothetical protein